jgi:hypothetical protein
MGPALTDCRPLEVFLPVRTSPLSEVPRCRQAASMLAACPWHHVPHRRAPDRYVIVFPWLPMRREALHALVWGLLYSHCGISQKRR